MNIRRHSSAFATLNFLLVALILAAVLLPSIGLKSALVITLIVLAFFLIAALYVLCAIWFIKSYWPPLKTQLLGLFNKLRGLSST